MDWSSGDNLVTGQLPEEDDVDHRVEPQSWLPGGAAGDQDLATDEAQQDGRQSALAGLATSESLSSPGGDAAAGDAAPGVDGARMPALYPDPSSAPKAAAAPVTSSFGTMTGPGKVWKRPPKPPKAQKPPRPAKAPRPVKVSKAQLARQAQNGVLPAGRAQFAVIRVEPWSVMKFSFMISLVGWVVLFVAVAALYFVLSRLGVFQSIEKAITNVTSSKDSAGVQASNWFSSSRVLGYTMLIGAVNVILITALATVGSVIYNLVTHVAGGIEVTLRDSD
jgi:Transmembrane domain of unknown function (DUF3566)